MCQKCLANTLPFQTVDDLDYELNILNGNNVSEENMDRLKHLKFNPFDTNNNIIYCVIQKQRKPSPR
jgi:hypothetical protein